MNDVTIIGTGPAGLTAAIYAARAGLKPVIYAGLQHGGQLTTTTEVENFPGFAEGIMGPKLMSEMTAQAERVGAKIIYDSVTRTDFSNSNALKIYVENQEIKTKTVIICTGATAKTLNLKSESALMGRGLSTCATCDGFFYRGKTVMVVGGGDSAMEEASYLANLASQVYLIHRRPTFRASNIMVERVKKIAKVKIMTPWTVESTISSDTGLTGVILVNIDSGEKKEIALDGLFYAIGHKPNSDIFLPWVDVDHHGYVKVTDFVKTKTPGVFAAGDIADPTFKQAITAAGMGCQAAISAARYIESMH